MNRRLDQLLRDRIVMRSMIACGALNAPSGCLSTTSYPTRRRPPATLAHATPGRLPSPVGAVGGARSAGRPEARRRQPPPGIRDRHNREPLPPGSRPWCRPPRPVSTLQSGLEQRVFKATATPGRVNRMGQQLGMWFGRGLFTDPIELGEQAQAAEESPPNPDPAPPRPGPPRPGAPAIATRERGRARSPGHRGWAT